MRQPTMETMSVGVIPETHQLEETEEDLAAGTAVPWVVIVWNDPVNLMSYVTYVFQTYFGYSEAKARTLMLEVHEQGELVESAEVLVQFLPISGAQHGIFVTAVDPDGHEFRSRLESLQFP